MATFFPFPETKSLLSSRLLNLESLHFLPPVLYRDRSRWDENREFHSATLSQIVSLEGVTEMLSLSNEVEPPSNNSFFFFLSLARANTTSVSLRKRRAMCNPQDLTRAKIPISCSPDPRANKGYLRQWNCVSVVRVRVVHRCNATHVCSSPYGTHISYFSRGFRK